MRNPFKDNSKPESQVWKELLDNSTPISKEEFLKKVSAGGKREGSGRKSKRTVPTTRRSYRLDDHLLIFLDEYVKNTKGIDKDEFVNDAIQEALKLKGYSTEQFL